MLECWSRGHLGFLSPCCSSCSSLADALSELFLSAPLKTSSLSLCLSLSLLNFFSSLSFQRVGWRNTIAKTATRPKGFSFFLLLSVSLSLSLSLSCARAGRLPFCFSLGASQKSQRSRACASSSLFLFFLLSSSLLSLSLSLSLFLFLSFF